MCTVCNKQSAGVLKMEEAQEESQQRVRVTFFHPPLDHSNGCFTIEGSVAIDVPIRGDALQLLASRLTRLEAPVLFINYNERVEDNMLYSAAALRYTSITVLEPEAAANLVN